MAEHKEEAREKGPDNEVEDIEAFLREQDGEDYEPPKEEEAVEAVIEPMIVDAKPFTPNNGKLSKDDLGREPTDFDLPKHQMEKKEDPRAMRKKGSEAARPVERGSSKTLFLLKILFNFIIFILPIIITSWIIGAWIGSWIEVGWLIAVVGLLGALIPGFLFFLFVRRGRIIWWLSGISVVLAGLLLGLFPTISAESLIRHGHWPVSAIAKPLGIGSDNLLFRGINSLDRSIGEALVKGEPLHVVPTLLGSAEPLNGGVSKEGENRSGLESKDISETKKALEEK